MTQIGKVKKQSVSFFTTIFFFIGLIFGFILFDLADINLIGNANSNFYKADTYQSIFLTNGSVFFGKIIKQNENTIVLQDVYYLKSNNIQNQDSSEPIELGNLALVKVTNDIHSPENEAEIRLDQVLFIQNLSQGSRVLQSIRNGEN